jgi:hypothetical protein
MATSGGGGVAGLTGESTATSGGGAGLVGESTATSGGVANATSACWADCSGSVTCPLNFALQYFTKDAWSVTPNTVGS